MTGREGLAEALASHEAIAGGWYCSCSPVDPDTESLEPIEQVTWEQHLADAALAHIAAVLHDDATVEAVIGVAVENHRLSRNESEYLTTAVLAVLAERLGVPHVDR